MTLNWDAGFYFEDTVLPVEYLSFTAEHLDDSKMNLVEWSTALEVNADYFILERSLLNATDFVAIAKIDATGNSNEINSYQYEDYDLDVYGTYYYRLRQYDNDGRDQISYIVSVDIENNITVTRPEITIYPNPAVEVVNFDIDVKQADRLSILMYARDGKLVKKIMTAQQYEPGIQTIEVDLTDIPRGVYMVSFLIGDEQVVEKLNVVR